MSINFGEIANSLGNAVESIGTASALPFRAYALIYNEWFRDQNLKNPLYISMGDADVAGKDITAADLDLITDVEKGAAPIKAAKYHDYFTSCLPEAQKGPAVGVPIGDKAPIIYDSSNVTGWPTYPTNPQLDGEIFVWRQATLNEGGVSTNDLPSGQWPPKQKTYGFAADLSEAVGATVNQLRQAFAIQKFYEKQALYGTRYIEMIKGHFGVTNPV